MKKWLIILIACYTLTAQATAIAQLKAFMADSKAFSSDFEQTVTSKNKKEKAGGIMEIAIPGKFRWNYNKPYDQLLVGDGKTLWIYDKELAQVTKKAMDDVLGSSPAALLAGSTAIEKNYSLKEIGKRGNLEWLSANPKKDDGTFQSIRMGFKDNMLVEMELNDSFGNMTHLRFFNMKKNQPVDSKRFQFTPPKGVDIITD